MHSLTLNVILWKVEYVLQQIGWNSETGPFIHPPIYCREKRKLPPMTNMQTCSMLKVYNFKEFITINHIPYACRNILRFTKQRIFHWDKLGKLENSGKNGGFFLYLTVHISWKYFDRYNLSYYISIEFLYLILSSDFGNLHKKEVEMSNF